MTTKARKTSSWLSCATLFALACGCSSQTAETKRQLETLNERLLILQNDRDRLAERVDALEARVDTPRLRAAESEATTSRGGRPPLKIVRLEPSAGDPPPAGKLEHEPLGEQSRDPSGASSAKEGVNPNEPKVVLYGEGQSSGVRASAEGVTTP